MSELTPNLGLFKYNTSTDGKEVFSIQTALNNNWDILDERCGSTRNIGEIVASTIPLTDAGLHLLDGNLIQGDGIYSDFVDYIANLYTDNPDANYFTDETTWQDSISQYGVCGKFVYDSVTNTVRLPKITGIIEGTTDLTALGDLVEAGLPNITGNAGAYALSDGGSNAGSPTGTGAFRWSTSTKAPNKPSAVYDSTNANKMITFDASRSLEQGASDVYGNSTTVQPQTIKVLYYIVVATITKTNIQVDIDEIATDLNIVLDQYKYDGQWVSSFLSIASSVTWKTDTAVATYSLANYLPNDNYNYEVLFVGTAATGSTSGNFVTIGLNSDLIDNGEIISMCEARTRTASTIENRGNAIIPIGTGRYIKQYSSSSSNANGTYSLWALGYRRIGTNS